MPQDVLVADPEHPLTLEQLNVVQEELITVGGRSRREPFYPELLFYTPLFSVSAVGYLFARSLCLVHFTPFHLPTCHPSPLRFSYKLDDRDPHMIRSRIRHLFSVLLIINCHFQVQPDRRRIQVNFTPTIPHCSMATLIGLSLRVKLFRTFGNDFRWEDKQNQCLFF